MTEGDGEMIYLVEFGSGKAIEVPEHMLESLNDR